MYLKLLRKDSGADLVQHLHVLPRYKPGGCGAIRYNFSAAHSGKDPVEETAMFLGERRQTA
jgi:hypothetical protein